jgi:hypothetical protein
MAHVLGMARRYNITHVYLATDDEAVIAETKQPAYSNLQFMFLTEELLGARVGRVKAGVAHWSQGAPLLGDGETPSVYANHLAAVVDITLMSYCTGGFVGKFSSNIDRLVYSLMVARAGGDHLLPYASLDWNWCSDFDMVDPSSHALC